MTEIIAPYASGGRRPETVGAYLNRTTRGTNGNQQRPAGRLLSISPEQFRLELMQRTRALCGASGNGHGEVGDARLSGDLRQIWHSGKGEHRQELRLNAWEYGVHDVCLRADGGEVVLGDHAEWEQPTLATCRWALVTAWEAWAALPESLEALETLRWCGYGRLRTHLRCDRWTWHMESAEIERQLSDERLGITGTAELMGAMTR